MPRQLSVEELARALAEGHELRDRPAQLADRRGQRQPVRCTLFPLRDGNKVVGGIVILRRETKPASSPS